MSLVFSILGAIWAHPWGRTVILGGALFIFGVVKGWGWCAAGRDAAIERAIVARDSYWSETIKKANVEHEHAMRKAIEAANSVRPVGSRDELIRLCRDPKGGADCRDQKLYRLQGVQTGRMVGQ